MTRSSIKATAAAYHVKNTSDLIVNGVDLWLVAANQAIMSASLAHDFNFQRQMLSLDVDTVTGGSLDDVVIRGTATEASIKTIIEMGLFDSEDNFIPVEWTTAEESHERVRSVYKPALVRYPTDHQFGNRYGQQRLILRRDRVSFWPTTTDAAEDIEIGIEAYVFDAEWEDTDLGGVTVTGTLSPDATGTYTQSGTAFGNPLYFRDDGTFFLYNDGNDWIITADPDATTNAWFLTQAPASPDGAYTAQGTYTGTATVTSSGDAAGGNVSIWTNHGGQYLLWQTIINLNKLFKTFVERQEGNLTEPQALSDQGLQALLLWDENKYEQFRRHQR